MHSLLPLLSFLLLSLLSTQSTSTSTTDSIIHIPLNRLPVPAARAFSFARRPWAANLPLTTAPSRTTHLHIPLTLSPHPHHPNLSRTLATEPVYGDIVSLGEYFLSLSFGGNKLNVQIDTGSSTIAVPLKQCLNCPPHDHRLDLETAKGTAGLIACDSPACARDTCNISPMCRVCARNTRACCSNVAPDACGFFLRYADKTGASGALVQADVTIAGITVPLAFGGILRETGKFENKNVDGILGMAYKSLACNPTCVTPLFDTLVQAGNVKNDIFSLCTAPNGGTLILGGSSSRFYHGDLQYVPMVHGNVKHFYDVTVKQVRIGDKKVTVPAFSDAIVDSGTTVLVISPKAYDALKSHFQENYCQVPGLCTDGSGRLVTSAEMIRKPKDSESSVTESTLPASEKATTDRTWFSPGYCVKLSEEQLQMLPNITIGLDKGVELVLEPDTYMLQYEVASTFAWDKIVYRCLGIAFLEGLEHMENNAILGNTVLQKYFVEYDRKNDRIGFAVAKNCVDPANRMLGAESTLAEEARSLPGWVLALLGLASVGTWVLLCVICARESRKYSEYRPIPSSR